MATYAEDFLVPIVFCVTPNYICQEGEMSRRENCIFSFVQLCSY